MPKNEKKRNAPTKGKGANEKKRRRKKVAAKDEQKRKHDEDESNRRNNTGTITKTTVVRRRNGGKGMEGKPIPIVAAILSNEGHPSFTLKFTTNQAIITLANKKVRDSFVSLTSCKSWKLLRKHAWQSSKAPEGSGIIEQDHKHEGPWRIIFNGVSNLTELRGFGRDETSGLSENQAKKKKILTEAIIESRNNTASLCTTETKEKVLAELQQKKLLKPGQEMKSLESSLQIMKNRELRKQPDNPHGIKKLTSTTAHLNCEAPRRNIRGPGHTKMIDGKIMFVDGNGEIPTLIDKDHASRLESAKLRKSMDDRLRSLGMKIPKRTVEQIMKDRHDNKIEDTSVFEVKDTL